MTIAKTGSESSSAGDGVSVAFSFPYRFFEDTDLKVYIVVNSTNVSTIQTLTTHYSIVNNGDETGGTITMVTAPVSGETLLIQREIPKTQSVDYAANDAFPAETHEAALDRLTLLSQSPDIRHITFPAGDEASPIIDPASSRASRLQGYDANGDLLTYSLTPIFTAGEVVFYNDVATLLASTEGSRGTGSIWEGGGRQFEEHSTTADEVTAGSVDLWEFGLFFTILARFEAAIARGNTYPTGGTVVAAGISYVKDGGTLIASLSGWSLAPSAKEWFVDSVSGSDSNDGSSSAQDTPSRTA